MRVKVLGRRVERKGGHAVVDSMADITDYIVEPFPNPVVASSSHLALSRAARQYVRRVRLERVELQCLRPLSAARSRIDKQETADLAYIVDRSCT